MKKEKKEFQNWWENYWYYYKWHTIAGIFVLVVLIITITECAKTVKPDLGVSIVTKGMISEDYVDFDGHFDDKLIDINNDGKKHIGATKMFVPLEPQNEQDVAMMQKVTLEFAGGDSSLFIFDKDNMDRYIKQDAFSPLDRFIDISNVPEERLLKNEQGMTVAISLKGCTKLQELGILNDDLYAAFLFVRDGWEKDEKRMQQFENAKTVLEGILNN